MATYSSYPQVDYTNELKLLAGDPSRSELVRVSGQSLFDYLNENLDQFDEALLGFTTTDVAVNEDLPIGKIIYTTGGSVVDDGNGGPFLVVAAGEGDIPMFNGNELLRLPFGSLAGSDVSNALITSTDGTATAAEYVANRTRYVRTVADLEMISAPDGANIYLTEQGREGDFVVKSGPAPSDPQKAMYINLASGNHAERKFKGAVSAEWFGAVGDGVTNDTAAIKAAVSYLSSQNGGDLNFESSVYCIDEPIEITTSGIGLIGAGGEAYITGDFGTTIKWIGVGADIMIWYRLLDAARFKGIALDCNNVASVGIRAEGVKLSQFIGFAIRNFTVIGFYGLCGTVAGQWSSGNLVQNFLITSQNNGVDGLFLDGDAAANNDWFNNTFSNGFVQVIQTATESRAGHLAFCDSNTFQEVDFSVGGGGAGTAVGVLFDAATRTVFPQNNNFYGCSIFSAAVNEPGANVISKNFMFLFPTKDGETIPTHPRLIGMTDEMEFFGPVLGLKRNGARVRLSTNNGTHTYDVLLNASDAANAGIQVIQNPLTTPKVVYQIDQNGDSYPFITGYGLGRIQVGPVDSAGAGFRSLRVTN